MILRSLFPARVCGEHLELKLETVVVVCGFVLANILFTSLSVAIGSLSKVPEDCFWWIVLNKKNKACQQLSELRVSLITSLNKSKETDAGLPLIGELKVEMFTSLWVINLSHWRFGSLFKAAAPKGNWSHPSRPEQPDLPASSSSSSSSPTLMKNMWCRLNAIVRQICLAIRGERQGSGCCCVGGRADHLRRMTA